MPKLSQIMSVVATSCGVPLGTVEQYAKPLRASGLLTSTGARGRAAADAVPLDAVRLLLAVLSGTPTRAVDAVMDHGRFLPDASDVEYMAAWGLRQMQRPWHSALARVIQPSMDLETALRALLTEGADLLMAPDFCFRLTLHTPLRAAEIQLWEWEDTPVPTTILYTPDRKQSVAFEIDLWGGGGTGPDLITSRFVSRRTLLALSELFN